MKTTTAHHLLACTVVATLAVCATVAGFITPVRAASPADGPAVVQILNSNQSYRTAVAEGQTFTVASTLVWRNNSPAAAAPESVGQIITPVNGVKASRVVFSSDRVSGTKLITPGSHKATNNGAGTR
ncbi:hypothetical protein ACFSSC_03785 [Corynebacterium mendelii]|uniref:DUF5666 domain-containing protein n=1 Tax=Corynebacterium mendelii TaxID=2765362 RepID=A0A939IWJ2_9CORY|nr:hypothetical protein [Corynebacterium mendelii]MBN9643475.1 hypothetical protein [Corynebacterium mendelii]